MLTPRLRGCRPERAPRRALLVDPRIPEIRERVEAFAASFPMPGFHIGAGAPAANGTMANGKH